MKLTLKKVGVTAGIGIAVLAGGGTVSALAGGGSPSPQPLNDAMVEQLLNAERTPIGDHTGKNVGTYDTEEGNAASERAGEQMRRDGVVRPAFDNSAAVDEALLLQEAYLTVNAVPVLDEVGELVGYAGWRFFYLDEYPAEKAAAEKLIESSK